MCQVQAGHYWSFFGGAQRIWRLPRNQGFCCCCCCSSSSSSYISLCLTALELFLALCLNWTEIKVSGACTELRVLSLVYCYRPLLVATGHNCPLLAITGRYWPLLAVTGHYLWQNRSNLVTWLLLANAGCFLVARFVTGGKNC